MTACVYVLGFAIAAPAPIYVMLNVFKTEMSLARKAMLRKLEEPQKHMLFYNVFIIVCCGTHSATSL